MLPSAVLWMTANRAGIVLPYIPMMVWGVPGLLATRVPVALPALLVALPAVAYALRGRVPVPGSAKLLVVAFSSLAVAVHVVWGIALLLAT
jgi:hypothetical protein